MNSDIQVWPPPSDPQVFESLCLDLWRDIWGPDCCAQKNGRRGQNQDGVDIFGKCARNWEGVQCKQKDGLLWSKVSPKELESEVRNALNFKPALRHFILATTGVRDKKVQERARELTDENASKGLFAVMVWSWKEIWSALCRRPKLFETIAQQYWPFIYEKPLAALHQLPPPIQLFGRAEQLAQLTRLVLNNVDRSNVAGKWFAFHGMAGVGKTVFAIAFAHSLRDEYPNAQLYLDLRGADKCEPIKPADVMRFVIRSFNPRTSLPEDTDELAALYRSVLNNSGRSVLIFDNVSDDEQIQSLLTPPSCLLIVTSRAALNSTAFAKYKIDCLQTDYSEQLLRTLSPRIEGLEVEAASLCGNLPLAMSVLAGVVNFHTISEPQRILDDFRARIKHFDAVNAAFEISFNLLSTELRERWVALSVFPSRFDIWAASAIWGKLICSECPSEPIILRCEMRAETEAHLQALTNANLVEWDKGTQRFRLHDLIRDFCERKLSAQTRLELSYCHSAHFCDLLRRTNELYKRGDENMLHALSTFDTELINIASGHGWAIDSFNSVNFSLNKPQMKRAAATLCCAYPLYGHDLFELRLFPQVRATFTEVALEAAKEIKDAIAEGSHLQNLGVAYAEIGNPEKAISLFNARLDMAKRMGDYQGMCNALGNLANSHSILGQGEKALKFSQQELSIRRKHGDKRGQASALCSLGLIRALDEEFDMAIEVYQRALKIFLELGDKRGVALTNLDMGVSYQNLGREKEAIESFKLCLDIFRQLRDLRGQGKALANLANIISKRNLPEAVRLCEESVKCKRATGDILGVARTLLNLGDLYLRLGKQSLSLKCAEGALQIYEETGDPAVTWAQAHVVRLRSLQQDDKRSI